MRENATVSESVTLQTKGLDALLKALKRQPIARVGILGNSVSRVENKTTLSFSEVQNMSKPRKGGPQLTNAEIGAVHEFGSSTHPQRSFLRVPLTDRLNKELEASGAFDKETLHQVIMSGTVVPWLKKVTVLAEGIVAGAFATGGYGKWAQWKSPGYQNNTGNILVDTTQLRNSITSEVTE
jgi:phage gpG-like protein